MDLYSLNGEFLGCNIARPDVSMFESIGVIGDSFASGVIDVNGTLEAHYNISWPQILKRMTGCNVVNYTKGGLSTKTWLTDAEYGLAKLNSETANNLYVIALGINDFNNEVALGTYDGNGTFPTVTTTFREAYAIMLNKIMTAYPTAEIWCATLPACERNGETRAPEINGNNVLLDDFNKAIRNLAQVFGAKVLEHSQCGLTYQNMSTYMGDWASSSSQGLHPNANGHSLIANNDIRQMDSFVRTRY